MTVIRIVLRALLRAYFRVFHRARVVLQAQPDFFGAMGSPARLGTRTVYVSNHQSFLDGLFIGCFLPRDCTFVIATDQLKRFRAMKLLVDLLPVDMMSPMAVKTMVELVRAGRDLVIFPEGRITTTGALMSIQDGAGMVVDKANAGLRVIHIDGLLHSKLSRMDGRLGGAVRRCWFPRIRLTMFSPCALPESTLVGKPRRQLMTRAIEAAMQEAAVLAADTNKDLFAALQDAAALHGPKGVILSDMNSGARVDLSYRKVILGAVVLGRALWPRLSVTGPVGVLLPNAVGTAVTVFALTYLRRPAAMLNFTAGETGILAAARVAGIQTVLTSRRFIEKAKLERLVAAIERQVDVVYLEDVRASITLGAKLKGLVTSRRARGHCPRAADEAAVILFTSGSEGAPKGVVLSHRNILSNIAQVSTVIGFSSRDRVLNALPMFHSFGLVGGLMLPVLRGVPAFQYPSPLHYRLIPMVIENDRSTVLFGTDSFLAGYARKASSGHLDSLRLVVAGAERVRDETRAAWMGLGKTILEGYGVTETSPVLAVNTPTAMRAGSVGRAVPGIECRLEPVPGITEGGRLFVRGPNVMLGYMREDAPGVLERPRGGWHDTGDIVTIEDGFITIRGRAKRFAKVAGEMVSLTAVEALVGRAWPDDRSVVVAVPDERKGERLVLVTERKVASLDDIRAAAKASGTPALMVPTVLLTAEIPLLGTGKVNYPAVQAHVAAVHAPQPVANDAAGEAAA